MRHSDEVFGTPAPGHRIGDLSLGFDDLGINEHRHRRSPPRCADAQDEAYQKYEKGKKEGGDISPPTRTLVIIEEAHEFLSAERIEKTKTLFQQVARVAKRGRKRWLGLVFVTQLPQHLPRQVLGLVNSYILHKITDAEVVNTLRRTVSGIDARLWDRLSASRPDRPLFPFHTWRGRYWYQLIQLQRS